MIIKSPQSEDDWANYFHLRWQVLRAPWSQPKDSEKDELEFLETTFHAMAINDNKEVIGVARLNLIENNRAQIRFMAVSSNYQCQGVGAGLINFLENTARMNKINRIILQARENALHFYLKKGYTVREKTFLLYNQIQHYRMEKDIY